MRNVSRVSTGELHGSTCAISNDASGMLTASAGQTLEGRFIRLVILSGEKRGQ